MLESSSTSINSNTHRLVWNCSLQRGFIFTRNIFVSIDSYNSWILLQTRKNQILQLPYSEKNSVALFTLFFFSLQVKSCICHWFRGKDSLARCLIRRFSWWIEKHNPLDRRYSLGCMICRSRQVLVRTEIWALLLRSCLCLLLLQLLKTPNNFLFVDQNTTHKR